MNVFQAPLTGMSAFSVGTLTNAHNVANGQTKDYRSVRADFNEGSNKNGVEASVSEDRALLRTAGGDVVDMTPPTSQNSETSQDMENPIPNNDVDLAQEFSSSVIYQRGFEANAATIKTQDEMIGAALDIKV